MRNMKNRRGGFSLIEVVVAVAILGIASVAILRHFSQSLYMVGRASVPTRYGDKLQYYFTEAVRAYSVNPEDKIEYEDGEYEFTFEFNDPTFPEAEDYNLIPGIVLKEITARVRLKSDGREINKQVTYYVLPTTKN